MSTAFLTHKLQETKGHRHSSGRDQALTLLSPPDGAGLHDHRNQLPLTLGTAGGGMVNSERETLSSYKKVEVKSMLQ